MSDFFANVGGFRMPDVTMNQGPLPTGGGINATPDGVINGTNSLLSGITPYAYGEAARMGSDRNYQQIPHRVQYIIPPLHLPSQNSKTTHRVCHVVDQGDMAFALRTRGRQWFGTGETVMAVGPGTLPVFGNLDVVNYILACMQLAPTLAAANAGGAGGKRSWPKIREHLWKGKFDEDLLTDAEKREEHLFECVMYSVQNLFTPHGVCAGSEHQGGQHEESWAPVQAAVNYTTTMTVDGQNRDLVNYWHEKSLYAGDRLVLRLVLVPELQQDATREFQLTSYYERPVAAPVTTAESYWQLQPWILNADEEKAVTRFDYRVTGYWHIAQSFQGRQSSGIRHRVPPGAPLQVTFAPVFVRNWCSAAVEVEWDWLDLIGSFTRNELRAESNRRRAAGESLRNMDTLVDVLVTLHVKEKTISKTIGRKIWTDMANAQRLICFGTITALLHFAKRVNSEYLTRRVLRRIVRLEQMSNGWADKSGNAIEIEVDDFVREVVRDMYDDFIEYWLPAQRARLDNLLNNARNGPRTNNYSNWVYHGLSGDASGAFGGADVAGVAGVADVADVAGEAGEAGGAGGALDVGGAGAAAGGLGCSAEDCVEGVRKPKKKRGLAVVIPDAVGAVDADAVVSNEAGGMAGSSV